MLTRRHVLAAATAAAAASVLTAAPFATSAQPTAAPAAPAAPWIGVHLMLSSDRAARDLIAQLPPLAALGINVLIAEVGYSFEYDSHPELRSGSFVTKRGAADLVKACRAHRIRLIPQFNCLGHQSWAGTTFPLLTMYPQFDETPGQFPGNKGIYCRSWCPLHPEVNPIVFALLDDLLKAFEADAMHVGLDEVFLIGSEHCPRCKGKDKAELFARAVNDYHGHVVTKRKAELLMWGDRLLDGKATGYGEWEAATNGTHPAIDAIPKDIILCDWHYEPRKSYPSIPLFLSKGFRTWPAGWHKLDATEALIAEARKHPDPKMLGHLCTTWGKVKIPDLATWPPVLAASKAYKAG